MPFVQYFPTEELFKTFLEENLVTPERVVAHENSRFSRTKPRLIQLDTASLDKLELEVSGTEVHNGSENRRAFISSANFALQ